MNVSLGSLVIRSSECLWRNEARSYAGPAAALAGRARMTGSRQGQRKLVTLEPFRPKSLLLPSEANIRPNVRRVAKGTRPYAHLSISGAW